MSFQKSIEFLLGKNQKQRFRRILIIIGGCAVMIYLLLNVKCGWDSARGFYYEWRPAANININKSL